MLMFCLFRLLLCYVNVECVPGLCVPTLKTSLMTSKKGIKNIPIDQHSRIGYKPAFTTTYGIRVPICIVFVMYCCVAYCLVRIVLLCIGLLCISGYVLFCYVLFCYLLYCYALFCYVLFLFMFMVCYVYVIMFKFCNVYV